MSRPRQNADDKLDAHIIYLRRQILKVERTLAREIKKRAMPCRCQRGGYELTQEGFEQMRALYETARTKWFAEHKPKHNKETDNA